MREARRPEAEALRKEYADKIANAEKDAAAMLDHARHEAESIVAKAEVDTTETIARREKMAQDKIAAAELAAVTDLRNQAAAAAAAAAKRLIAANHSADADKALLRLLARDKEGTKELSAAREFSERRAKEMKQDDKGKGKAKELRKGAETKSKARPDALQTGEDQKPRRNAYSATLIKQLGFDPSTKDGKAAKHADAQSKVW